MTGVDAAVAAVRMPLGRRRRRPRVVVLTLALALVALAAVELCTGDIPLSPAQIGAALLGHGSTLTNFTLFTLRLPLLLVAMLAGCAFAVSGGLFQSALRNPLASPDILGVSGGASVGAVAATLLLHLDGPIVPVIAVATGLLVAALIVALSWREGLSGYRFVLLGIAFAFVVSGALGYLLTRADVQQASAAFVWLVGDLGTPDWNAVLLLAIAVAVAVPAAIGLHAPLSVLALGDDTARGLGVRPSTVLFVSLGVAVVLASVATAFVGPIAFVALVCAPIAQRAGRTTAFPIAATTLTGAALVVLAEFIAGSIPGVQAPVGLVTGLIGAPYLLWLLGSRQRAGVEA